MLKKLLKYRNILFDEWIEDEYGVWTTMCADCLQKYGSVLGWKIHLAGYGCCSVQGCNQNDDKGGDMKYIDFNSNAIEFVE